MALTKITGQVIRNTTDVTVGILTVTNTLAVGGTVSIGGTLTYEDVTNIDSVGLITARRGIDSAGIITARQGLRVNARGLVVAGVTTFSGNVKVGTGITLSPDGDAFFTGIITGNGSGLTNLATDLVNDTSPQLGGDLASNGNNIQMADNDEIRLGDATGGDMQLFHDTTNSNIYNASGNLRIRAANNLQLETHDGEMHVKCIEDGAVELYHDNTKQCETNSTGLAFPDGKGISFAATGDGSGTMTSELLDDYEEGTFNVTLPENGSGNQTVTNNPAGRYTKIGSLVYAYIYAIMSGAPQNNSSGWQIGGLPYAANLGAFTHHGFGNIQYTAQYNYDVWRPLVNNSSKIYFHRVDGSGNSLTNSDVVSIGMTYFLIGVAYMV